MSFKLSEPMHNDSKTSDGFERLETLETLETLEDVLSSVQQSETVLYDIFTDKDPVKILDDGDFIAGHKIRDHAWSGPGVVMAYAKWCPYCQRKVEIVNKLALKAKLDNKCVYVIDAEDNPIFTDANNVESYPTFYNVNIDGTISKQ
jgi:thiol-disulfide isomerase/thioredoxin